MGEGRVFVLTVLVSWSCISLAHILIFFSFKLLKILLHMIINVLHLNSLVDLIVCRAALLYQCHFGS